MLSLTLAFTVDALAFTNVHQATAAWASVAVETTLMRGSSSPFFVIKREVVKCGTATERLKQSQAAKTGQNIKTSQGKSPDMWQSNTKLAVPRES